LSLISLHENRKSARQLALRYNCIGGIDVPHPIPAQHTAAGASSGAHMPTEKSDKDTDVDAYFNTAMLSTQQV
jgi:hypothetical protein